MHRQYHAHTRRELGMAALVAQEGSKSRPHAQGTRILTGVSLVAWAITPTRAGSSGHSRSSRASLCCNVLLSR
jgi:hypothetical protein